MARFCHFYPGMTPAIFWDLEMLEYRAMSKYMTAYEEAEREAVSRARSRRRR